MNRARKRFGQHFLEPAWVDKVIDAIAPRAHEVFLEIGPGRGALTRPLAARVKRLCAVEIDRDLAADLRTAAIPNVTVVEADFLDVPPGDLSSALGLPAAADAPWRAAGNLPYNVASPILFKLVGLAAAGVPFGDALVMLQREVADRLTAAPGTRDYGVLSVLIGYRAVAERVLSLPPGAFRPAPRVHSALVRLRFHQPSPAATDERVFATLVQAIFTRRRKTLTNALMAYPLPADMAPIEALRQAAVDGRRRPETLSISELVRLADVVAARSVNLGMAGGPKAML